MDHPKKERGLTQIGSLVSKIGNTQQIKDLMKSLPDESVKNSRTTGLVKAEATLPNLIGAVRGGIGACEQLNIKPAFNNPVEETVAARVVRTIRIHLKQPGGLSLDEQQKEEISNSLEKLGGGSVSEREARTAKRITVLLAHYPQAFKNDTVLEGVAEDWLEILGEYPYFAVETACKHWLANPDNDFTPKVSRIASLAKMYGRNWLDAKNLTEGT